MWIKIFDVIIVIYTFFTILCYRFLEINLVKICIDFCNKVKLYENVVKINFKYFGDRNYDFVLCFCIFYI